MRVCVRPTPAQGRFLLFLSLLVSLRALQQALLRLCPSPLFPTMAAGLEHGMSKLLRMMRKKDKSSQDQIRQQFKVEPFTSGQANAPASSSRPFNPTASAPAAFISERSRTPPGMVTTIGHGKLWLGRRRVGVDGFPRVQRQCRIADVPGHLLIHIEHALRLQTTRRIQGAMRTLNRSRSRITPRWQVSVRAFDSTAS